VSTREYNAPSTLVAGSGLRELIKVSCNVVGVSYEFDQFKEAQLNRNFRN